MKQKPFVVIGGGPAGMMAALTAAENGKPVVLVEKNKSLGRKMRIAGKGRCNITNDCTVQEAVNAMVGNGKFLYSALTALSPADVMGMFEDFGVPLKVERGNRVFPVSDQSGDLISALERKLRQAKVNIQFLTEVKKLRIEEGTVTGVVTEKGTIPCSSSLIATGGLSYPLTGSTGDGYDFARELGHTVTKLTPALVPLVVKESYVKDLEGLSLRNCRITIKHKDKKLTEEFGEMVFTSFGLSGPIILTMSRVCAKFFKENRGETLDLTINFKPALTDEQIDKRIIRELDEHPKRQFIHLLESLLPKKMVPVFLKLTEILPQTPSYKITRVERQKVLSLLTEFPFTVKACRPIKEAIVTAGGVNIKEINPKTMESKLIKNLYFAGEVLDVDGVTGGFNMQSALSTGYVAGLSAAKGE